MKINELLTAQDLNEGSTGAGIGAGIGALAGSALGPLGTGAGAALGGAAGNWIGNKASNAWQSLKRGYSIGRNTRSADANLPANTGSTATTNMQSQPEISGQSAAQTQTVSPAETPAANTAPAGTSADTPAAIRQRRQAAAARSAQDQMAASSSPPPSAQPAGPSDSDVHPRFGPRRRAPEVQPTTSGETPPSALSYFSLPNNEPAPQSLPQVQPSSQSQSQSAPAGQTVAQTPRATVTQVKKSIGSLRTRDLHSVKDAIDQIIAKRQSKSQGSAGTAPATPQATPNLTVQQGGLQPSGKKRKAKPASAAQPQATGTVEESIFYSKFLKMDI